MSEIGKSMSYGEAVRLTRILSSDPASHVAAALNGWDGPRSLEWFALADVWDALASQAYKKPKPYPRPTNQNRHGRTSLPRERVLEILRDFGHDI